MNQDHVRDSRQPGHFWADNEIVDDYLPAIGIYGFAVYMLLTKHADAKTGQCDPSVSGMATTLGISAPTVRAALDKLKDCGLINIRHRRREKDGKLINQTSVYTLLAVKKAQRNAPTKADLVPNEIDQGVLNQVEEGTKGDLVGVLNQVSSNNTHKNKNREREGGAIAPTLTTPAIDLYIRLTGQKPLKVAAEKIAEQVTDLSRWRNTVRDWLASGYKPNNVVGMLDWYNGKGRHQNNNTPANRQPADLPTITAEQVAKKATTGDAARRIIDAKRAELTGK